MHDIKFKCEDNETRQLDETIYSYSTVYAETKSDFYFKIKVEKVTNDEFNGNRKL